MRQTEWPTLGLFLIVYAAWAGAVFLLAGPAPLAAAAVAGVAIALHSSLQHEALHGHPFRSVTANSLLAGAPLTLVIPYLRFRDTHLAHHRDSELTDPYDDPESNFLDGAEFERMPSALRALMAVNNTLAGRLAIGPAVGTARFLAGEWRARGQAPVRRGWAWHLVTCVPVAAAVWASPMPLWAYGLAVYLALALLKIRTFLEHRAHDLSRARSVVIEDRGPLALLFLNNNLHAVHHMHPRVAWYRLPELYRANREKYLEVNGGYLFRSYGEVFARYFLRAKDPVAHPLWRRG